MKQKLVFLFLMTSLLVSQTSFAKASKCSRSILKIKVQKNVDEYQLAGVSLVGAMSYSAPVVSETAIGASQATLAIPVVGQVILVIEVVAISAGGIWALEYPHS